MTERKGVTAQLAKIEMRRRLTLIGAMMLHKGEVAGMICGTWGSTANHLLYIDQVIGKRPGVNVYAAMNGLILPGRQVFLVDTHVNADPTAAQLAEITIMAAEEMKRLGIVPKAALLSHSSFGASSLPSAQKMRDTLALLREQAPWLEVDGEMHGDAALDPAYRARLMPNSTLTGEANLLVMPNIDAANISYNLLKTAAGGGIAIGPVLLGAARAGARADAVDHRAPHHQHDRADRGRRQRGTLRLRRARGTPVVGQHCGRSASRYARAKDDMETMSRRCISTRFDGLHCRAEGPRGRPFGPPKVSARQGVAKEFQARDRLVSLPNRRGLKQKRPLTPRPLQGCLLHPET